MLWCEANASYRVLSFLGADAGICAYGGWTLGGSTSFSASDESLSSDLGFGFVNNIREKKIELFFNRIIYSQANFILCNSVA